MKKVLIKCGGSTLDQLSIEFFNSLHELKKQGYAIIIVHGGGPDINKMLAQLHVEPEYMNGLRKTNEETMHVVEMVLSGKTNRELVQKLYVHGLNAIGLNGSDADLLIGEFVDQQQLGFVGEVQAVNLEVIEALLEKDIIPVITPIAIHRDGTKLNVNADYAAAAVAEALQVDHCLFVTDVEGILINGEIKQVISLPELENYIKHGAIYGGMLPKVKSAVSAIQKGIKSVRIVAGMKGFYHNEKWQGTQISTGELIG